MQRSRVGHFKRLTNRLDHAPHILIHLVIAETHHPVAALGKPCGAPRIMLRGRRFEMIRANKAYNWPPRVI
jgi:hypothetical protein